MEIGVIIPLFNEEDSLEPLFKRLKCVLDGMGKKYEILFVNDGSTDRSKTILDKLFSENVCVKVIHLRRNFGKAAALMTGFKNAKGDVLITMDADLQDIPEEIPKFLREIERGSDLVNGWRAKRQDPFDKTIPSKIFNFMVKLLTGIKLKDFNCGFKAYRSQCLTNLMLYGELHRFIPVMVHWQGYKIKEIPIQHDTRRWGRTKYGIRRFFKGLLDLSTVMLNTRYLSRPLHLFGFVGIVFFMSGLFVLTYLTVLWFSGVGIADRPLLTLGYLLLLVGVQIISVGLLGELIIRKSASDLPLMGIERILKNS